jgi:5-(carboxyamino)imidazole ribonucleotide synthase
MSDKSSCRPGLLGAGQLSLMLVQKAQALGLDPSVFSENDQDCATRVTPHVFRGNSKSSKDLENFAKTVTSLTFESEFHEARVLKKVFKKSSIQIFPSLGNLEILQDRKSQKEQFEKFKIPTSPFLVSRETPEILFFFKAHGRLVAKKRTHGYDGYGTFFLNTEKEVQKFCQTHRDQLDSFLFEKMIPFKFEVAVQAARSRSGDIVFFPFVQTQQKDKKCFLVTGPEKPDLKIQKFIRRFLSGLDYVGVAGFEFFKTRQGLILNEIAPRVHNTGHHTMESCDVDQFTLHWLCAFQDRLPQPQLKVKSFAMLNLIGTGNHEVVIPPRQGGHLHWYGKSNRAGRKLGHITWTGPERRYLVEIARQELRRWNL